MKYLGSGGCVLAGIAWFDSAAKLLKYYCMHLLSANDERRECDAESYSM